MEWLYCNRDNALNSDVDRIKITREKCLTQRENLFLFKEIKINNNYEKPKCLSLVISKLYLALHC